MYLWDTDWIVDFLNGRENAVRLFAEQADEGIAFSIVTYAELYEGVLGSNRRDQRTAQLDQLLEKIDVFTVDLLVAQAFGQIRLDLRRSGQPIPDNDVFIAATAVSNGLTLISRDSHFDRIAGLVRRRA